MTRTGKLVVMLMIAFAGLLLEVFLSDLYEKKLEAGEAVPGVLSLTRPAFAQTTSRSFLDDEAGISVYVRLDEAIDLTRARALYRVLEDEVESYLIGSVELPGYEEEWWPHVWIHHDGWIVVYYSKTEPASRLMHWSGYQYGQATIGTTTLREMLLDVARQLGADVGATEAELQYYHWQYPNASRMLTVIDTTSSDPDDFVYTIPRSLSLYELSGSHYGEVGSHYSGRWSETQVDGERFLRGGQGTYVLVDFLADKYHVAESTHTVTLRLNGGWTGIALFFLYR